MQIPALGRNFVEEDGNVVLSFVVVGFCVVVDVVVVVVVVGGVVVVVVVVVVDVVVDFCVVVGVVAVVAVVASAGAGGVEAILCVLESTAPNVITNKTFIINV